MPNLAVTLLLVAKTEKGWRRMPVAFGRNGKIRPQYALVDVVPVHSPAPIMRSATSRGVYCAS